MLTRSPVTLSELDNRIQDVTSEDLLLLTQDTPDGLRTVKTTIGDLLNYVLQQPEFVALSQQQFLRAVSVIPNDPILSGNGTDVSPLKTNITSLNRTFTTKEETNLLADALNTLTNRVTNVENTLLSSSGNSGVGVGGTTSSDLWGVLDSVFHVGSIHETLKTDYHPAKMIKQLCGKRTKWELLPGTTIGVLRDDESVGMRYNGPSRNGDQTLYANNIFTSHIESSSLLKVDRFGQVINWVKRWKRIPDSDFPVNIALMIADKLITYNSDKTWYPDSPIKRLAYITSQGIPEGTILKLTCNYAISYTGTREAEWQFEVMIDENGNGVVEIDVDQLSIILVGNSESGGKVYTWAVLTHNVYDNITIINSKGYNGGAPKPTSTPADFLKRPTYINKADPSGRSLYFLDPRLNPKSFSTPTVVEFSGSLLSFLKVIPPENEIVMDGDKFNGEQINTWQSVQNQYTINHSNATTPAVGSKMLAFTTVPHVPTYVELELTSTVKRDDVVLFTHTSKFVFDEWGVDELPKPIGL